MINTGHPNVAARLGRVSIVCVPGPEVPFTIEPFSNRMPLLANAYASWRANPRPITHTTICGTVNVLI